MNQVGFTDTAFTIDLFADTNNITGGTSKLLVADSASFSVSGVASGMISESLRMFGNSFGTGMGRTARSDLISFTNTPGLQLYNLASSTAVFTESGPCCIISNLGTHGWWPLSFSSFQNVSFQAMTNAGGSSKVPEPAPLALLGLGFLRKHRG